MKYDPFYFMVKILFLKPNNIWNVTSFKYTIKIDDYIYGYGIPYIDHLLYLI